jgi:hypothetical protein
MSYIYAVRGWLELSWPDAEFEGVDESAEEHAAKVQRVYDLLTTDLSPEQLADDATPPDARYKAGWGFPQNDLKGTEYVFYGADVEEPAAVLKMIRQVLELDPFADGYFSVEREDGEMNRQWLVKSGKVYMSRALFPDFDSEEPPKGYILLPATA